MKTIYRVKAYVKWKGTPVWWIVQRSRMILGVGIWRATDGILYDEDEAFRVMKKLRGLNAVEESRDA